MRWNSLKGVPRGSKNGSGAIIRMRTARVIFSRNRSTVSLPFSCGCPRTSPRLHQHAAIWRSSSSWPSASACCGCSSRASTPSGCGRARGARRPPGWPSRFAIYALNVAASVWRWHLLLAAQHVHVRRPSARRFVPRRAVLQQLPAEQHRRRRHPHPRHRPPGALEDARRRPSCSSDRVIGLIALVLVAATGATVGRRACQPRRAAHLGVMAVGRLLRRRRLTAPAVLAPAGFARLLQPLAVFHPEWVGDRIDMLTTVLARFRERPSALASCFAARRVRAGADRGVLRARSPAACTSTSRRGTWRSSCRCRSSCRWCRCR